MTLINCTECGKQISDTAANCPHCGASTGKITSQLRLFQIVLLCAAIVGVGFIVYLQFGNKEANSIDRNTEEIEKLGK